MSSDRTFFVIGSIFAVIAVAAGAFGAHGLQGRVEPRMLEVFSTATRYQMFHALALLAVALGVSRWPAARLEHGGWLLAVGTLIFSGSLYVMVFTGVRWFGAITPVGGVLMIAGWVVLAWRTARQAPSPNSS